MTSRTCKMAKDEIRTFKSWRAFEKSEGPIQKAEWIGGKLMIFTRKAIYEKQ
jgi:hypothetical protein